ncbi:MAG: GNAT family N-acetyltransferase [Pseudomonadota bacterium]
MVITTPRLIIRPFRQSDLPGLEPLLGDPAVMEFSLRGPATADARAAWLARAMRDNASQALPGSLPGALPGALAVEAARDAAVLGYVSLSRDASRLQPGEAELGFRLVQEAWGHGFAREAAEAVISTYGSAYRIVALIDPSNRRSLRVVEKLGMQKSREVMLPGYDYPDLVYSRTGAMTAP